MLLQIAIGTLASRVIGETPIFRPELIGLPEKEGGLGIPRHASLAPNLYKAAQEACRPLLQQIQPGFNSDPLGLREPIATAKEVTKSTNASLLQGLLQALNPYELKARLENASFLGRQWIRTLPTQKNYLLADSTTTEALRARLLIACRPLSTPCSHCGSRPNIGHEDLCRAANRRWISRHN